MTKWNTEYPRTKWWVHQSLARIMQVSDTNLWKTSSSFMSLPEESQFKLQKPLAWDPSISVSREATFAVEEPSSYFLWPKSQFGLLSCISLDRIKRQSVNQQKLPQVTKRVHNTFCISQLTLCPLFRTQRKHTWLELGRLEWRRHLTLWLCARNLQ